MSTPNVTIQKPSAANSPRPSTAIGGIPLSSSALEKLLSLAKQWQRRDTPTAGLDSCSNRPLREDPEGAKVEPKLITYAKPVPLNESTEPVVCSPLFEVCPGVSPAEVIYTLFPDKTMQTAAKHAHAERQLVGQA